MAEKYKSEYKNGERVVIINPNIKQKELSYLGNGLRAKHFNNETIYYVICGNNNDIHGSIAVSNVTYEEYKKSSKPTLDYLFLHSKDIRPATFEEVTQEIKSLVDKVKLIR